LDIVLRGIVLFAFVSFVMRIVGRRELSSLGAIDLVLLIVLGDAIQQGLTQDDYSLTGAFIVITTFVFLQVATSYVSFRWAKTRPILEGEPIVLVQDGTFLDRNLKRERMTAEEVAEEARLQQIDSLEKVKWAVLEPSGKISFIT
jgi:uncharacterized membrane protein YcaP (DUF421 family)